MCLTAKNFGLLEENNNIPNQQGNTTNFENGMGYRRQREMENAVLYEKGG